MAVTGKTLDNIRRSMVFRKDKNGGLIDLNFDVVNLDGESYYEPVWPGRRSETGDGQRGVFEAPLILDRNTEFPVAASSSEALGKGQFSTWFYGGR